MRSACLRSLFAAALAVLLCTACAPVFAATRTVTHCLDDGSPGSLRSTVAAAQHGDVIDLSGLDCPAIALTQGPVVIGTIDEVNPSGPAFDLTFTGPGADRLAIQGTDSDYVLFNFRSGTLTLEGLTVSHGRSPPTNVLGLPGVGGCVFAIDNVTLRHVALHDCTAQYGGGVLSYIGDIRAEDSVVHDNRGILYAPTGQVAGAGLMAMNGFSFGKGNLHLLRSEVYGNVSTGSAVLGGAVFAHASLTVTDSVLRDNHAVSISQGAQGGAGLANLNLTVTRSRLYGNSVSGGVVGMGGALYGANGVLTLTESSVYDNRAAGSSQVYGGGIHSTSNQAVPSVVVNSTVSGNRAELAFGSGSTTAGELAAARAGLLREGTTAADVPAGLPPVSGGGLSLWAPLNIANSTIAFNTSHGNGGGLLHIATYPTHTVTMHSAIVAANQAPAGRDIAGAEQSSLMTIVTGSHNLVQSVNATVTLPADTLTADPRLLPLADNGGPTPTHELRFDSPALDAGTNPSALAFDQRGSGFPRELGAAADIGAYELDVANTRYRVTPTANAGGRIDPALPQEVVPGQTATFTLTPDPGFQVLSTGGSCGGSRTGATFTTAPVVAHCTVEVRFVDSAMMPVATVTPGTLSFDVDKGDSGTGLLTIGNTGTGLLEWTLHASAAARHEALSAPVAASATARLAAAQQAAPAGTASALPTPARGSLALSQTTDLTPVVRNSAACYEPELYTTENRYFRRFYFRDHPEIGAAVTIQSVDVAVESSTGKNLTVNLYTLPAATTPETIPLDGLTLIGTGSAYALGGSALSSLRVPVQGVVANTAAYDLVVEIVAPSGIDDGGFFYIGSTRSPETHATFMMAPACDIDAPTRVASLGFPNMRLILVVNVDDQTPVVPGCDNPTDIPWLRVTPEAGATAAGQTSTATVSVDSAGLTPGVHSALLCVASNDIGGHTPIEVPVRLRVAERQPIADVTPASFRFEATEGTHLADAMLVGNRGNAPLTFDLHTAAARWPLPYGPTPAKTDASIPGAFQASGLAPTQAAAAPAGAPPAGALPLAQTQDQTPAAMNSIACGSTAHTSASSYYRRFHFAEHPAVGARADIAGVDVGVESSNGIALTVNLYTVPAATPADAIPLGQLTLIGSAGTTIAAGTALQTVHVPVTGAVTDTTATDLVVEVAAPDGSTTGSRFFIGSTPAPETRSGFMMAPACGITNPAPLPSLGRPDMHLILVAYAVSEPVEPLACDDPATIPWLALGATGGVVAPLDLRPVALDVRSGGLAVGEHHALLCMTTNDPQRARIEVPVTLAVTRTDCIFGHDFEAGGGNRCGGTTAPPTAGVVFSGPVDHPIAQDRAGTSIHWTRGEVADGERIDAHFNAYFNGRRLAFWWPGAGLAPQAGVALHPASAEYRVLERGDTVGPAAVYSAVSDPGSTLWSGGGSGYLGFRFGCAAPGGTCYGYLHLETTAGTGFPARIVDYAYDPSGRPIRIR
ncbi:choice-of-anchor Q domain-containing protein [Dokdonella koreensis]|uniref:Cadherin domain-containing protein n=1 Tax=Dokdonella koreensis DS-123 TaxID=1300342 RepID=A0A167GEP5_9GAMM|nr:choice-of-anchor Q domain-containing protein [Dokdonella koreensis]ANB16476.1 Cadherin domain-containing protein [Dokdonella koreensis DS-123]